jgi:regulator of replication initiation timing
MLRFIDKYDGMGTSVEHQQRDEILALRERIGPLSAENIRLKIENQALREQLEATKIAHANLKSELFRITVLGME